jgi:hypothetical protein
MRRFAAAAASVLSLLAIGFASPAATTSANGPASVCPRGSLHTIYKGTHKCLRIAVRRQIYAALVGTRDRGLGTARTYAVVAQRFRVGVGAVRSSARESAVKGWPDPPALRLPEGVPILAGDAARAARDLAAMADCLDGEPGRGIVRLSWRAAADPGSEQRLILTIYRGGFERGLFEATGPLAAGRTSFDLYRLHGQAIHTWKVLTRHDDGWVPSAEGSFVGPTCPVDSAP